MMIRIMTMKRMVLSIPGMSCAIKIPLKLFLSALHQVVQVELLDHRLAVSTDLIGYIIEIHGIEGIEVGFEGAGLALNVRDLLPGRFLFLLVPRDGSRGGWGNRCRCPG